MPRKPRLLLRSVGFQNSHKRDFEAILFGPKISDQCQIMEQDSEPLRKNPTGESLNPVCLTFAAIYQGKTLGNDVLREHWHRLSKTQRNPDARRV